MHCFISIVITLLGCVVFTGSHSYTSRRDLQLKNIMEHALTPLIYAKERHKRATNQNVSPGSITCTINNKQMNGPVCLFEDLTKDPSFLANFNIVFPPATVKNDTDRNKTSAFPPILDNEPKNTNNSGLDDRLQGVAFFHESYAEFSSNENSTAPPLKNEVDHASHSAPAEQYHIGTNEQEQAILDIYGVPPPSDGINVPLGTNSDVTNTADNLTTTRIQKTDDERSKSNSMAPKFNFSVHLMYLLICILLV